MPAFSVALLFSPEHQLMGHSLGGAVPVSADGQLAPPVTQLHAYTLILSPSNQLPSTPWPLWLLTARLLNP